ncbi:hypothetical protein M231_00223 [Tremella mesenterica]|uniref:Core domain-containing protein n=1 Tax=Tremella mesenterica TaxID=5217 RepID=A0A4Q1BWX6_TREME|nr:hypothetical protein M231_00223 [Tremella mesenterica]
MSFFNIVRKSLPSSSRLIASTLVQPTRRYIIRSPLIQNRRPASTSTSVSPSTLPEYILPSHSSSTPITPLRVTSPSIRAIQEEGYLENPKLLPPDQAFLHITPEAVQQLSEITSREPPDVVDKGLALRVGVESGGCHGYQYTMVLTEERGVDDYVMQPDGVDCIPVVVDLTSLGLLKGATLHHATELIGSSFRIQDNPQAKQGGSCGCGISWEANEAVPT